MDASWYFDRWNCHKNYSDHVILCHVIKVKNHDINYNEENNILTLSCGSNGVLLYSWDGMSLETTLIAHVLSSYAYTAKVFDVNKIIVGTEYGVEVYNLGD